MESYKTKKCQKSFYLRGFTSLQITVNLLDIFLSLHYNTLETFKTTTTFNSFDI